MAGEDPSGAFDAAEHRTAIRAAMLMGIPEDEDQRPIFKFKRTVTFAKHDKAGKPFTMNAVATTDVQANDVTCGDGDDQVVCVWDAGGAGRKVVGETAVGDLDPARLVLTVMDVDWEKISDFESVVMSGNVYVRGKVDPIQGLFDVMYYFISIVAQDES